MLFADIFAMTTTTTTTITATPTTTAEHPLFNEMVAALWRCHRRGVQRVVITVDGLRNCRRAANATTTAGVLNVAWTPWPSTRHTTAAGLAAFLMPFTRTILFLVLAGTTTAARRRRRRRRRLTAITRTTIAVLFTTAAATTLDFCHSLYSLIIYIENIHVFVFIFIFVLSVTRRLNNIHMGKHMTATAHFCKSKRVHDFAFWRLVDIFRGEVNYFINV